MIGEFRVLEVKQEMMELEVILEIMVLVVILALLGGMEQPDGLDVLDGQE